MIVPTPTTFGALPAGAVFQDGDGNWYLKAADGTSSVNLGSGQIGTNIPAVATVTEFAGASLSV